MADDNHTIAFDEDFTLRIFDTAIVIVLSDNWEARRNVVVLIGSLAGLPAHNFIPRTDRNTRDCTDHTP
jgi:hypothetical protein